MGTLRRQRGCVDAITRESAIDTVDAIERPHQQAGADQQDQGERYLHHR